MDTGLPRGNVHEWDSGPMQVPSLPNPTTRKGWPHHWGLQPLLYIPVFFHLILMTVKDVIANELTFLLPKANAYRFFASLLVTKPYLYVILLTIRRGQSQAKAYLKTFLNAKTSCKYNSLVYRYIFFK